MKAVFRAVAVLALTAAAAFCYPLTWTLSGAAFNDGGTLSGTFVLDADAGTVSNWNLVSSAGSQLGAFTYTPSNSSIFYTAGGDGLCAGPCLEFTSNQTFDAFSNGFRILYLGFVAGLTDSGGSVNINTNPSPNNTGIECINCNPDRQLTQGFATAPVPQTVSFDPIPSQILGISPLAVGAKASSGLPVGFASTTPSVCSTASGLVMLVAAGTCSIQATQAGNSSYQAASVTRSFTVSRAKPAGTLTMATGSPFMVGTNPEFLAVGDFNGDGIPDLATANSSTNNVTVLLGTVSGGYTAAPGSPFGVGSFPVSVVVGDFNGDGKQDLAVSNNGDGTVTVLLGNGMGGFSGAAFDAGPAPFEMAAGDFNGDGILDLAVPNLSGSVRVFLGNGAGGFEIAPGSPITVGSSPFSVAVGDFNGDGIQDLAIPNFGSNNVTVLLGIGSGQFAPAQSSPFSSGGVSSPLYVTVGDFNGDGSQDLAIANDGGGVTVLLGNGMGGFMPALGSPFGAGVNPGFVVAADFNGDGIQDLAVADFGTDGVSVLLGNGSGGFTQASGSPFSLGGSAQQVYLAVADFNGDGIEDLGAANFSNGNVAVLLGTLTPTSSVLSTTSPATIILGQSVSLTLTVSDNGTAFNTLTGTATFKDGATTLGTAVQNGSPYTFNASSLAVGSHALTASYGGGSGSAGSASNAVMILVQMPQTISFGPPSSVVFGSGPVILTATASSGLTVSYVSTMQAVCQVVGNVVTLVNGGTCSITASQAGNASYVPAPNVSQSFNVTPASQTISFGALSNVAYGSGPVPLTATATSGLPVSFASTTPAFCTLAGSSVTLIAVGPCSITASQPGNPAYAAAPNVVQSFSIIGVSQTITFAPLSNVAYGSGPVTLTATATSGLTVTFVSTTTGVCAVAGNTVTLVGGGICSVTASQAGSSNYAAAPNVVQSFTVTAAPQTITFAPLSNVAYGSGPVTLTATATSGLAVSFASTTTGVCTVAGNTVTLVSAGSCSITASQAGNASYAAAPNVVRAFNVSAASQTITFAPLSNVAYGSGPVILMATATSGLAVSFASTTIGVCTVAGNTVTLVGGGTCSVTASQAGNFNYAAAPNVVRAFNVSAAPQTITFGPLSNVAYGSGPLTLTATATSGLTVSFASTTTGICTVAGNTVMLVSAGSCSITASQAGNANYTAAPNVVQGFNVTAASQTITFGPLSNITYGQGPIILTATASSGLPVSFISTTPAVCTVSGSTVSIISAGTCSIAASQAGNASYTAAANVAQSFTVAQAAQTITFAPITLTQISVASYVGTPIPLSAYASSGLPVTFSSTTSAVCTVSGSSASVVGIGMCTITASQAGNGNYLATSTSQSFNTGPATQTITFNPVGTYAFGAAPFALSAVSTSGLTVTFNTSSPGVCTVNGTIVTILGAGTCSITASQSGNTNFAAAASVTQAFTVNPPVVIPPVTLPTGLVSQPYPTVTLAATGGSGALSWTLIDGSLPTGITLSGGGSLRGTPTVSGTFPFSVEVVDAGGDYSGVQALALQIRPALSITTTTLPNPVQGVAYSQNLVTQGGSGNYTWSVSGGALPSGISLSAAGALSGTPTISGPFSFTAQVSDGTSTITQTLSLQVSAALTVTTSASLPGGVTGKNYSTGFTASGGTGGPYTWSVASGALPAGLSVSASGIVDGNPSVAGTFSFTIQVNDGVSPAANLAVSLTIYSQISITTTSLPNGAAGQPYTPVTLNAQGGSGTFTWSVAGLPNGLSLSSAGTLSGTPTATGSSTITVTAIDSVSSQALTASLSLSVVTATGLRLSTSNLVVGAGVNTPLSGTLTASGGTAPYIFSAVSLPAGLTLSANGATATIGGSSATAGTFMAMVTVTDSESTQASVTAKVTIQILGLTTATTLPTGAATVLYTANFSAAGGTPPYVFSATGLPAGLSLSGNGALSGTVMSSGSLSFTVQTSDRAGLISSNTYSLTIGQAPVSVPVPKLPAAVVGTPYSQTLAATGGAPPYSWSLLSGVLPAGLSLAASGTISGIPTAPGISIFAAQATDASGGIASAKVTIGVTPSPLTFTTNSLPSGIVGFAYPQLILGATGGTPPYTFAVTDGALPPGVTLSNGVVGGTATTAGTFPLTITVTDSAGIQAANVTSIVIRPPNADLVLLASFASFSLTTGATGLPPAQAVGIQSSVVAQPISYTVSVNPASPWLSVTSGGITPGTLNLSLTSAALAIPAGTTQTIVTLTCTSVSCQGNTQNVAVTLAVASPPAQLSVTNSLLSFTSASTPPAAQTQPLGIQNIGGGTLAINSITCEARWCTVGSFPPALTPGPATPVNITADPSTLSTGYFRTAIDIASSSGTISIPVTFFVTESPSLNLSPAGAQFSMQAGGAPGNPKGSFFVTVAGGPLGWTAALLPGANWVTLNTASGTSQGAPSVVSYVINGNAASLTPGPYYATIEVTSASASNSPQDYEIVLNVTPANQAAVPDPEPAGLLFLTTVGGTPPAQIVTVYSSSTTPLNYQASATETNQSATNQAATNGVAWLSVAPLVGSASTAAPGQSTVSINTEGLKQGVYAGGVSYASNSIGVRTVNVTLIVQPAGGGAALAVPGLQPNASAPKTTAPATCTPTTVVPTQTGLAGSFSAPATWPINLAITLADDCGNTVVNGTVVATFTNGDPELALPQLDGNPGLYSATWTPGTSAAQVIIAANAAAPGLASAVAQINGSVAPNSAPSLNQNGILNVFNPVVGAALAPGTVVAIYGQNLAALPVIPTTVPLPTSVNGTSVRIGSTNAPLFYVSPTQINVQVPFELDPAKGPYAVRVIANGVPTASQSIQLTAANPALAAYQDGTVIAVHGADGTLVTQDSPAQPSEYIVMYLVGMGTPGIPVASGTGSPSNPAPLVATPVLTLGGNPVTYAFAGLTPTAVGLYQINLQVPPDTPRGNVTLAVSQNGMSSNTTILPIAF